jgi:O-antigen ligase
MVAGRVITLRKGAMLFGSALCALALILACESALFAGVFQVYVGQHTSQVRSTEGRLAIWHRSLEMVRSHPLLGVGSSNSALVLTSSADQEETTGFASRTFSLPLQVLTEKGIIGFGLYSIFLVLVGREFILGMRYSRSAAAQAWSVKTAIIPGQSTCTASSANESARAAITCCFAAGLAAVLGRELVYSSLFEHTLTLALTGILCALLVNPDRA